MLLQCVLLNAYMLSEKFKRMENGCRISCLKVLFWTVCPSRLSCLPGKRKKVICGVLLLVMKSGFTLIIPSGRTRDWTPANHPLEHRNEIFTGILVCIWSDQEGVLFYELFPASETVTAACYHPGKTFGLKFIPNQSDLFRFISKSIPSQFELIWVNPKKNFNLVWCKFLSIERE